MHESPATAILEELFFRYPSLESVREPILATFRTLVQCFQNGGTLLVCGNGGSAADCEHIVGELMKTFRIPRPPTREEQAALSRAFPKDAPTLIPLLQRGAPAISLVSQSGLFSAYANDVSAEMVFAQQVFVYGKPGDALLAITTSGASANVLTALKVAKAKGLITFLLMGSRCPENAALADYPICVPEEETYKVQELHLPIYHALCAAIEAELFS